MRESLPTIVMMAVALLLALFVSRVSFGAEAEDKDLIILQLKKSNLEFAMENMVLQSEVLKQKYKDAQAEYEKVKTDLDAKEKETKNDKKK